MLGSALQASASVQTATSTATPSSPSRPSRLRGLSYLRNYTHNHLHRDSPPLVRTVSSPNGENGSAPPSGDDSEAGSSTLGTRARAGETSWTSTSQGRSVVSRARAVTSVDSTTHPLTHSPGSEARHTTRVEATSTNGNTNALTNDASGREPLPTIRFIPHVESRASRPSLQFTAVSRTLKQHNSVVRVGRYSERDNISTAADAVAPVGFKSKVVSRRHCEFWCKDGQWFVKDIKSSSGTFLNHVRLSPPGAESPPYPVNDGDVVQLGIDFKGGEEQIFRCVKIRVQCNRGWQRGLNNFNMTAHKRLLKNALKTHKAGRESDTASTHSSECSICLNPVAPCQALFVAPCSHVWHYKCISTLLQGPNYPNFHCPNCRLVADLEADVEPPEDFEDFSSQESGDEEPPSPRVDTSEHLDLPNSGEAVGGTQSDDSAEETHHSLRVREISPEAVDIETQPPSGIPSNSTATHPVTIVRPTSHDRSRSPTDFLTAGAVADGPMTPRNDVGPFVLDGGAGELSSIASTGFTTQALYAVTAAERSSEE